MNAENRLYKVIKTCKKCGSKSETPLSKREAVFGMFDEVALLRVPCASCAGTSFTLSSESPRDKEILLEWATNPELYLIEQDEDLLLAHGPFVDIMLSIIDTIPITDGKRNTMLSALCVLVYDISKGGLAEQQEKLKRRIIRELNSRHTLLMQAGDQIMDYIKQVVYPQLEAGNEQP